MKKGFTLIELLIVISIIGILAVALLPNILSAPATARDAGRRTSLNNVITALEQYKASSMNYPDQPVTAVTPKLMNDTNYAAMMKFFKGNTFPKGAEQFIAAEQVFGVNTASATAGLVYCALPSNTNGYSYVVAIRLEQKFSGDNALKLNTLAADCSATTTPALLKADGESNWYFLVQ